MKLVRFLLFPFAVLYDLITSVRNIGYNSGFLRATSFERPVIAVGNLSVGGTGKSPQVEYLIRLLAKKKTAVLSRGYKRKTKGYVLLDNSHDATQVGDEPLQFFRKFQDITVAVDADRVSGIRRLIEAENSEVIILDDAYQHRKVNAGLYILLTKYNDLYADDFILPTGNLRESRRGAKRAHVIVVTKCPNDLTKDQQHEIERKLNPLPHQQVFFTKIGYANELKGAHTMAIADLQNYEVLLVTGIAWPKPLLDFLDANGVSYKHLKYPDHHHFSSSDITSIEQEYHALKSSKKIMLTTEKDYVRLSDKITNLSYIEIETKFMLDQEDFDKTVLDFVEV